MISQEIGVNFSNLEYSIIKKRNKTLPLVFLIISITSAMIMIPFIVLWILKQPIEINEVIREYYEVEYKRYMVIFFSITGSTIFIFLLLAYIFRFKKPLDYIVINKDINLRKFYQIFYKTNESIFITENKTFYYKKDIDEIREVNDYHEVVALKDKYLFWERWERIKGYQVLRKNKKTILVFKNENQRTVLNYRYYFPTNSGNLPEEITEVISNKSTSRNSIQSYNTFYFTDNNRQLSIKYPSSVLTVLNEDY